MKTSRLPLFLVPFLAVVGISAQERSSAQYDPLTSIAGDLNRISASVQMLNERLKSFVDKFEKVGGMTFSEKQQKLVLALEFLVRAEERLATLQKAQIELVEKQGTTRARLAQVERDSSPQGIERSVTFEGTTRTEEIRESRRNTLNSERGSLQSLLTQINSNLNDTTDAVRDAQVLVQRLRRQYLPQIEREIFDQ
ncbi:MAG TPA: hypothetical protein VNA17_05950 [Pyrinomonadaceae bacterium]|nr:hypothetical protein [Pyrinomonadaceae bacterium]